MARYYNVEQTVSVTNKVFISLKECDNAGNNLDAQGGISGICAIGVRYYPAGENGSGTAGFKILYENGAESIMLNEDIVINYLGSPVGSNTIFDIYNDIFSLISL